MRAAFNLLALIDVLPFVSRGTGSILVPVLRRAGSFCLSFCFFLSFFHTPPQCDVTPWTLASSQDSGQDQLRSPGVSQFDNHLLDS